MKKLLIILIAILPAFINAQEKVTKADLTTLPRIKKEAKRLQKEGWYASPGTPMEIKIEKAISYEDATDDKGQPKYLIEEAFSVGETQIAARNQAMEVAKVNLAGKISTQVGALIESSIANQQLNEQEAASVTKTVEAAKSLIKQELGQIIELYSLYKPEGKKNMRVLVKIAYNQELAIEAAKKVIRKKLENETEILHDKLDKILDF
jgi:hypothetical protein